MNQKAQAQENIFLTLAKAIVTNDAKQFKNQHPEYSTDPGAETRQSLALLKNKPLWKERYQEFMRQWYMTIPLQ